MERNRTQSINIRFPNQIYEESEEDIESQRLDILPVGKEKNKECIYPTMGPWEREFNDLFDHHPGRAKGLIETHIDRESTIERVCAPYLCKLQKSQ